MTFAPLFCAMARQRRRETRGSRSPATKISHPQKIVAYMTEPALAGGAWLFIKNVNRLVTHEPLSPASGGFRKFARTFRGRPIPPVKGGFRGDKRGICFTALALSLQRPAKKSLQSHRAARGETTSFVCLS